MSIRGRLRLAIVTIFVCIVILYAGFYAGGELWDGREHYAEFARSARQVVGDQPAWSWGDQQTKLVYYFGRPIPNAQARQEAMILRYGPDQGQARWEQWLRQPGNAPWIFAYANKADLLGRLGFQVVEREEAPQNDPTALMLLKHAGWGGPGP